MKGVYWGKEGGGGGGGGLLERNIRTQGGWPKTSTSHDVFQILVHGMRLGE